MTKCYRWRLLDERGFEFGIAYAATPDDAEELADFTWGKGRCQLVLVIDECSPELCVCIDYLRLLIEREKVYALDFGDLIASPENYAVPARFRRDQSKAQVKD